MKFFENQKIDLIGVASVKLQKILISLSVIAIILALAGADFFTVIISLALYAACFYGAYKRKENFLRFVSCLS